MPQAAISVARRWAVEMGRPVRRAISVREKTLPLVNVSKIAITLLATDRPVSVELPAMVTHSSPVGDTTITFAGYAAQLDLAAEWKYFRVRWVVVNSPDARALLPDAQRRPVCPFAATRNVLPCAGPLPGAHDRRRSSA